LIGGANVAHPFVKKTVPASVAVDPASLASTDEGIALYLHPSVRAAKLDPSLMAPLAPAGRRVEVVRHGELLNDRTFPKSTRRQFDSTGSCYGELMVSNVYSVLFPASGPTAQGLLPAILAGKNRVHMTFEYHFFGSGNAKPLRAKESVDVPLKLGGIDGKLPQGPETTKALIDATNDGLRLFLSRQQNRLPSSSLNSSI
jgi:hypothetical protein